MNRSFGNQFILVTGISGSGKSCYGEHLRKRYGFQFIETDVDQGFISEAVFSNRGLVSRYMGKYGRIAVEWGFRTELLQHLIALKKQSAKLLWFFTAVEATARWAYCVKWEGDSRRLRAWENQMKMIRESHLPTVDFQLVETFRDGRFRPFEELDEEILQSTASF